MLRRLYHDQPESFAFTEENRRWAEAQLKKFPEGRQASAIIPLLWRAQEQEGWLSRPAIEHVAEMLGMAYIRALEVATFYFMFQLQPTGSVAHVQVCGTTSCMICGAEDLMAVCREKIGPAHKPGADGKLSWEEVECLGACSNAPMAQIGKDYYEDLTAESFAQILDDLVAGKVPQPGPQDGRYASEPAHGLTCLRVGTPDEPHNASVTLALAIGDTVKRIDGSEVPLRTPWIAGGAEKREPEPPRDDHLQPSGMPAPGPTPGPKPAADTPPDDTGVTKQAADVSGKGRPSEGEPAAAVTGETRREAQTGARVPPPGAAPPPREPARLEGPRDGAPDDLTRISGVGPKISDMLHELGIYHFDQIAGWGEQELAWIDEHLTGFQGRAARDDWVGQARRLSSGGEG